MKGRLSQAKTEKEAVTAMTSGHGRSDRKGELKQKCVSWKNSLRLLSVLYFLV